jgi:hypothetical protein
VVMIGRTFGGLAAAQTASQVVSNDARKMLP